MAEIAGPLATYPTKRFNYPTNGRYSTFALYQKSILMIRVAIFAAALFFTACAENEGNHAHNHGTTTPSKKEQFKDVVFANEKDYICGMPITAGVSDTAHYNGKIYGFCATECKEAFLKDPEPYIAGKQ